jgi:triosephosphate isomerase (TIM)
LALAFGKEDIMTTNNFSADKGRARKPFIVGNWKMHGLRADGLALASALRSHLEARATAAFDMAICPPATLLAAIAETVSGSPLAVGGQDCSPYPQGAHTGDISAAMLADAGARYVIIGHSERRQAHAESDAVVCAKLSAARAAGLTPILCIGETLQQREAGLHEATTIGQLQSALTADLIAAAGADGVAVAYEPVWAIGTGRIPDLADIAAMHGAIRQALRQIAPQGEAVRTLYGGSVNPANAADILALADVDGALVGGASLKLETFWAIACACPA